MAAVSRWAEGVGQNLVSTALVAVVAMIGVWLASLTPLVAIFAPLSYLIVFLVVALIAALVAYVIALFVRKTWPKAAEPREAPLPQIRKIVQAEIAAAIAQTSPLPAEPSPGDYLAYERWLGIRYDEIQHLVRQRKEALEQIMHAWAGKDNYRRMGLFQEAAKTSDLINQITSELLGKTYEFSGRASLDDNPHRSVPGDEGIDDQEKRHEFRKTYYDAMRTDNSVQQIERDFNAERSKVYNAMVRRGRELQGKLR
jgi:phosphate/sulfate permease